MYAKNRIPMYEGDGIIRQGPSMDIPAPERLPDTVLPRGEQQSNQTLAHLLRQLADWARTKLRSSPLDEYLSRATSLADAERLLRKAESEKHFHQY